VLADIYLMGPKPVSEYELDRVEGVVKDLGIDRDTATELVQEVTVQRFKAYVQQVRGRGVGVWWECGWGWGGGGKEGSRPTCSRWVLGHVVLCVWWGWGWGLGGGGCAALQGLRAAGEGGQGVGGGGVGVGGVRVPSGCGAWVDGGWGGVKANVQLQVRGAGKALLLCPRPHTCKP
jgi:hypothetical protein